MTPDIAKEDWEYLGGGDIVTVDEKGIVITDIASIYITHDAACEHRAHLIKAAPRLYRALLALVDEAQPLGVERPAHQEALAAINDAEGLEP